MLYPEMTAAAELRAKCARGSPPSELSGTAFVLWHWATSFSWQERGHGDYADVASEAIEAAEALGL